MEGLENEVRGCSEMFDKNDMDINSITYDVALLKSLAIRQQHQIQELTKKLTESSMKQMAYDVLIHNVEESENENTEQVAKEALKKLQIKDLDQLYIEDVYRIGRFYPKATRPRTIVFKLSYIGHARWILQNAPRPRTYDPKAVRITAHYPVEVTETRRKMGAVANNMKTADRSAQIRWSGDRLMVNKTHIKDVFTTPDIGRIVAPTAEECSRQKEFNFVCGQQITELGSMYQAAAVKVHSLQEARDAYAKFMAQPEALKATHNMAAFRIVNPFNDDEVMTNYNDDGDYRMGQVILRNLCDKKLDNVMIIVVRHFGHVHLGQKRYNIMNEVINSALHNLKNYE